MVWKFRKNVYVNWEHMPKNNVKWELWNNKMNWNLLKTSILQKCGFPNMSISYIQIYLVQCVWRILFKSLWFYFLIAFKLSWSVFNVISSNCSGERSAERSWEGPRKGRDIWLVYMKGREIWLVYMKGREIWLVYIWKVERYDWFIWKVERYDWFIYER